ncbi:MAG: hypothetical protein KC516_03730 [Nanoarchaeota archaeon]|nr:hypothetical protein [Nanoarchaeota archaeon]
MNIGGLITLGAIALILVVLAMIVTLRIAKSKKRKRKPDYAAMFSMGIVWLVVGLIVNNSILWALGLIFSIIGIVHFKEWKKNRIRWKDLSKKEKKLRIKLMIVLFLLLVAGIIALIFLF